MGRGKKGRRKVKQGLTEALLLDDAAQEKMTKGEEK